MSISHEDRHEVTDVLAGWNDGSRQALDKLIPMVERELRRIAASYMAREPADHTLQPTALVNECFLRLLDRKTVSWKDRTHFFAFACRTMRRILVDHARTRRAAKRGSGVTLLSLTEAEAGAEAGVGERDADILAVDEALKRLAEMNQRQSRIVELRFFGGLSIQETADALNVAVATANRDWASARAWLFIELQA
ncbi:MAG: sigma-70 family RNA polymerase sigma factor [Deltaproteobacteria bacterium]|nr:sigma-70 family RNA polymerase sigma factor [Deltaproteobacteria bacterium]